MPNRPDHDDHDDHHDDVARADRATTRRQAMAGLGAAGLGLAAGVAAMAGMAGAHAAPGAAAAGPGGTAARELAGKNAIVTGARNHLGRAYAVALARNGANVLVHYHRAETRREAEETARMARAHGVKVALAEGDLGKVANIKRMYDTAEKQLGPIDIVINNAGYIRKRAFAEITEEEFDRAAAINTKAMFFSMQEAARRIRDHGRIINIGTSLLGATIGMYSVYAGTKGAIEQFTRALAKELGPRGITVNVVAPGAVDTPFFHGQETPQTVEYVKKAHVAGRLAAIDDIVGMVEFLTLPRARWVSAQTIFVNNAYLAR